MQNNLLLEIDVLELESLNNEEIVKLIQTTNEEKYWEELQNRTKKLYGYVLKKYVHSYYKKNMPEDIMTVLKTGWVNAVNTYNEDKATSDFVPYCSYLMYQSYKMFARRITEDKIGNSVRDDVMSNVFVDGYDNTEKMLQGCMEHIMKCDSDSYEEIETKDMIRDMMEKLKEHNELQYIVVKEHLLDGVTQKMLGEKLNISQSAVSRLIKKGLNFLKYEIIKQK